MRENLEKDTNGLGGLFAALGDAFINDLKNNPNHVNLDGKDKDMVIYHLNEFPSAETMPGPDCIQHIGVLDNPFMMIMGIPPLVTCDCWETCERQLSNTCFMKGKTLYDKEVGFDNFQAMKD